MRGWLAGALIALGVLGSVGSATVRQGPSHTNDLIVLFPLELVAVIVGGIAAAAALRADTTRAASMLAVGLYLLAVAGAIATVFPIWLPEDNTILGSALLAGALAGVGTGRAVGSALLLRSAVPEPGRTAATIGAVLIGFVLVTAGGVVAPLAQLHLPLLVVVVAWLITGRFLWQQRHLLVGALVGAAATIAVLVLRGPEDWATASTSIRLFSFPILVMALGVSLALLRNH